MVERQHLDAGTCYGAEHILAGIFHKAHFWEDHTHKPFNEHRRAVINPAVRSSSVGGLIGIALALVRSLWLSAVLHVSGVKVFPVERSFIIVVAE